MTERIRYLHDRLLLYVLENGAGKPRGRVSLAEVRRELQISNDDEYRQLLRLLYTNSQMETDGRAAQVSLRPDGREPAEALRWIGRWLRRCEVKFEQRDKTVADALTSIEGEFSMAGRPPPNAALVNAMIEKLSEEFNDRADLLLKDFKEAIETVSDINQVHVDTASMAAAASLKKSCYYLLELHLESDPRLGEMGRLIDDAKHTVELCAEDVKERVRRCGEKEMKEEKQSREGHVTTVTGDNNIVVFGLNQSPFDIHFESNSSQALIGALTEMREQIQRSDDIDGSQKDELVEVTQECETELGKAKPNRTLLLGLLSVLGGTVQSIAALQPAYVAVKAAALAIGITLP